MVEEEQVEEEEEQVVEELALEVELFSFRSP